MMNSIGELVAYFRDQFESFEKEKGDTAFIQKMAYRDALKKSEKLLENVRKKYKIDEISVLQEYLKKLKQELMQVICKIDRKPSFEGHCVDIVVENTLESIIALKKHTLYRERRIYEDTITLLANLKENLENKNV